MRIYIHLKMCRRAQLKFIYSNECTKCARYVLKIRATGDRARALLFEGASPQRLSCDLNLGVYKVIRTHTPQTATYNFQVHCVLVCVLLKIHRFNVVQFETHVLT